MSLVGEISISYVAHQEEIMVGSRLDRLLELSYDETPKKHGGSERAFELSVRQKN